MDPLDRLKTMRRRRCPVSYRGQTFIAGAVAGLALVASLIIAAFGCG
jgi:hypothetical protein